MAHGNKKYNFEDLKKKGDTIIVNTANVYSLKNSLRLFSKGANISYPKSFLVEDKSAGDIEIKRIK